MPFISHQIQLIKISIVQISKQSILLTYKGQILLFISVLMHLFNVILSGLVTRNISQHLGRWRHEIISVSLNFTLRQLSQQITLKNSLIGHNSHLF